MDPVDDRKRNSLSGSLLKCARPDNAAEQALRHAVIWRKLSFGTQSASGSRFVERLLTVIETSRRQGRDVFAWLAEAVQAHLEGRPGPSLLPAP